MPLSSSSLVRIAQRPLSPPRNLVRMPPKAKRPRKIVDHGPLVMRLAHLGGVSHAGLASIFDELQAVGVDVGVKVDRHLIEDATLARSGRTLAGVCGSSS